MYCPSQFAQEDTSVLLQLIAEHPLATVISHGPQGLVADHVPLMFEPAQDSAGKLIGHVARHNPLWQACGEQSHLLVFQGPSTYISPNWYATKAETGKVVPTWNYAVVHVHARLKASTDPHAIRALLDKLTRQHEVSQPRPWAVDDAPTDYIDGLLGKIVAIEFEIEHMQGKWKVSQNQPSANRQSVVAALQAMGNGQSCVQHQMAELVRAHGQATPGQQI